MRILIATLAFLSVSHASAQITPLINELCASNHGCYVDADGHSPDWIELFNTGTKPIDLLGWRIAINGKQHVIDAPLRIPAKGQLLLLCDAKPDRGPEHLGFTLEKQGGAVLLIAPDGLSIADLFTYPALRANTSIGRMPDGHKAWSLFAQPTPGEANRPVGFARSFSREPQLELDAQGRLIATAEGEVRYTIDGSDPHDSVAAQYSEPVDIAPGSVVRAIAVQKELLIGEEAVLLVPANGHAGDGFTLALDPQDLWSDSTGIYNPGAAQNHTRRGLAWERSAIFRIDSVAEPVGARLFGSGSRSLGKRSFKLHARDRYDSPEGGFAFSDGTRVHEGVLRADASPNAFLRNAVMEQLVQRFNLHLLVQPSVAKPLYLNGDYWGLYRWMPAKDAEWLKQRSGSEALDVLEGPAATERSGKDDHFLRSHELLVQGASVDSIEAMIDTRSLIDLACIDLWTGRADHELNVRCYRPRERDGRWRWVLFDMDLWAPPNENSVQRMTLAVLPETPFVPQLLAHTDLQQRLLARITALQATAFALVPAIADSLYRAHAAELAADFKRWDLQLDMPTPEASLAEMKGFAAQRPVHLFAHLAKHTGRRLREAVVEAPRADQGELLIEGLQLSPGKHTMRCFDGVPVRIELRVAAGHEFAGWKGADLAPASGTIDLWKTKSLRPVLRSVVP
ncbi:MAG: CotH kinase family protein [Flavobacteriales bacterium]|nr:CotH kinase family protein [Flavobacteriales bacterium]